MVFNIASNKQMMMFGKEMMICSQEDAVCCLQKKLLSCLYSAM